MSRNEALEAEKKYLSGVEAVESYIEHFDILETVTNVGNDEVFTPRKVCKVMLDALPDEVWANPNYRWLNPFTKNGIFEREIALKLNEGLKTLILDEETRKRHILQDMIYSIGLTKFTALVARRTLYYCSSANRKDDGLHDSNDNHALNGRAIGNGTWFEDEEGNIKTPRAEHSFGKNGKCVYCGMVKDSPYNASDQLEHYAYEFIHHDGLPNYFAEKFFGGNKGMKFDIIIGNPPYQLKDGGGISSAQPIYQKFVQRAFELQPKYVAMIIPSRWMQGGKGLDEFRKDMLSCRHFRTLHDYIEAKDCFPSFSIEGGVCYFVWDRDYDGPCHYVTHEKDGSVKESDRFLGGDGADVVMRDKTDASILNKVKHALPFLVKGGLALEGNFSKIVSKRLPYGLPSDFFKTPEKAHLLPASISPIENGYRVLGFLNGKAVRYLPTDYAFPKNLRERESKVI